MKTIRALRLEQGWTQFELALRVGVQPQAVYLWESGRRVPQVPQMRKLGQLFGICSDEIVLEPISEASTANGAPGSSHSPAGRAIRLAVIWMVARHPGPGCLGRRSRRSLNVQ